MERPAPRHHTQEPAKRDQEHMTDTIAMSTGATGSHDTIASYTIDQQLLVTVSRRQGRRGGAA